MQSGTECRAFAFSRRNALSVIRFLLILQDVSLYPQTAFAPLVHLSGRLDRNHSVLIGQYSGIKKQRIIYND
ncbi:hypothetical protein CTM53_05955 [Prevotella intermedia]|uniref:Uncharacterized protein n=1 Tax=Prevotella intermedia TaxID=28131 RepID=A0AAJ3RU20_PREIN|nr:hypothetical protein CTM61_03750 [Prevotella intermedia]PJI20404.1 hypothetical protein CTM53_05955 [Prevotella intermedia]